MITLGRKCHYFGWLSSSLFHPSLRKPSPHIGVPLIGGRKYGGGEGLQKGSQKVQSGMQSEGLAKVFCKNGRGHQGRKQSDNKIALSVKLVIFSKIWVVPPWRNRRTFAPCKLVAILAAPRQSSNKFGSALGLHGIADEFKT